MNLVPFIPVSFNKNLGEAYNYCATLIGGDDEYILYKDGDVCFLTPDWMNIIKEAIQANPQYDVYTCLTNRVGNTAQCHENKINDDPNILNHITIAKSLAKSKRVEVIETKHVISGHLMIFKKSLIKQIGKFSNGILGVDTDFSRAVFRHQKRIGIMQGLYVFHVYRLSTGILDKSHLR